MTMTIPANHHKVLETNNNQQKHHFSNATSGLYSNCPSLENILFSSYSHSDLARKSFDKFMCDSKNIFQYKMNGCSFESQSHNNKSTLALTVRTVISNIATSVNYCCCFCRSLLPDGDYSPLSTLSLTSIHLNQINNDTCTNKFHILPENGDCPTNSIRRSDSHIENLRLSNYIRKTLKIPKTLMDMSMNHHPHGHHKMNMLVYIILMVLIAFTSRCNTQMIARNVRSITDDPTTTTTEHSKINPSYTLTDYNQIIRQQAFNSPHLFCGDPPLVPNAQSNLHRHQKHYVFPIGQEAVYSCEQGFKAVGGNSETRCIIDGVHIPSASHILFPDVFHTNQPTQSGRQGSNRSKNSKRLSDLDEEPDLNEQKSFANDDKRKMSRKTDDVLYDLDVHADIKKQRAHWYPHITLNCQMVKCDDPGQVEHARRNDPKSGILSYNSNVHYVCDDGYETIGMPILTCKADGTWNRSPPQCRLKQCPLLPDLKNGYISYSDADRKTNSRAEYNCNAGYRLNAASTTRLCSPNDQWSPLEPTYMTKLNTSNEMNSTYECLQVTCPTPVRPHNGLRIVDVNRKNRVNRNVFIPGDIIIFSCVSNRMKVTAKCRSDGEWSQSMPHCPMNEMSALKCAPISSFTHGSIKVEQNKAFFSCDPGYELDGGNSINCNTNGVWSGPLPRCVIRMTIPQNHFPTTFTSNHSSDLVIDDSLEKQEHSISRTLLVLLILISIVLFILIGVAMIAFYKWRQRRLNSKTWQRYFGHYYHRQSKTNIVLSSNFGNNHFNGTSGGTTGSNSNASVRLLQRGVKVNSKGFPKSSGYLQSSFSSADETTADMKSFTTEQTVASDRARTISTYVDDTCPEDDEYDDDEDNVSIYKSTTFPIATKQHNSLPLDILSSNPTTNNNDNNAAKRTLSSGNDHHIYSNIHSQPLSPNVISPTVIIHNNNNINNSFNKDKLFTNNNGIPVTDL